MKAILVGIATIGLIFMPGCAVFKSLTGGDIRETVEASLPFIETGAYLACTEVLAQAGESEADRAAKAKHIFHVARSIRSLSGGKAPSPEEMMENIRLYAPDKEHWWKLSLQLGRVYEDAYKEIHNENAKVVLDVLEAIATGCEDAARPFIKTKDLSEVREMPFGRPLK
ncbi:MAG: hypothetical protein DWQ49_09585 [Bacteroidetes bacterium]|nr:MAG: hypothetical protein DWQ49_09585 [Bacteroidota bacterium]